MVSLIFLVFEYLVAALRFVARVLKAIFTKWWNVDPASTVVCIGMLIVAGLARGNWLILFWLGAASCLSVAAACKWQWSFLEDLNRLQSGGVKEFLWSAPKSSRVEVVGARRDQSDVTESGQFATVERASDLLHRSIIGQKASIETVVSGLEAVAAGTRTDTVRPLSFMMIGPTGVGKT
jgi:hypothetical protein